MLSFGDIKLLLYLKKLGLVSESFMSFCESVDAEAFQNNEITRVLNRIKY